MDGDLDAFFDDVDEAVEKATQEESEKTVGAPTTSSDGAAATEEIEERPAKRTKVIAASSSAVTNLAAKAMKAASSVPVVSIAPPLPAGPPPAINNNIIPPPPPPSNGTGHIPPPPPPNHPSNNASTAAVASTSNKNHVRSAAGQTWTDPTLIQWPENDFRLFVGNLAKDLKQHHLEEAFGKYPSFCMARIMYDRPKGRGGGQPHGQGQGGYNQQSSGGGYSNGGYNQQHQQQPNPEGESRGYGFVSLLDPKDCARAIREMDQSWLGSRPIKVKRSEWKDREWKEVKKRGKGDKRNKKYFGL